MSPRETREAAVLTVGTELVAGLAVDTNTAEIAAALLAKGVRVAEALSVPDAEQSVAEALRRLTSAYPLVVVTGGLGPTHDDVTREAAARALGLRIRRDEQLAAGLAAWAGAHGEPEAAAQVLRQADVIEGARVLEPTIGTAPGLEVDTPRGLLFLLPGPPDEMRSMLPEVLAALPGSAAPPRVLSCAGLRESDAQLAAQRVLAGAEGVGLGLLAKPGDVRVVLFDEGAGEERLAETAALIREALGDHCYADDGSSLAEAVLRQASRTGATLALAESCTGGLVAAALTAIPGSSSAFLGGIVSYSNDAKEALLGVAPATLEESGAVSERTAVAMAEGARAAFGADVAVSVTGIAGPEGGTAEKPVGTVWFGVADERGAEAVHRLLAGGRDGVRVRATAFALDLLRRRLAER